MDLVTFQTADFNKKIYFVILNQTIYKQAKFQNNYT